MLNIKDIEKEPQKFDNAMIARGLQWRADAIIKVAQRRKDLIAETQSLQAERNFLSKKIGELKSQKLDASELLAKVASTKDLEQSLETNLSAIDKELEDILSVIPNLPLCDVPVGKDENDNKEVRRFLEPKSFNFKPKEHYDIGEDLGMMDFETAAEISGSRFVILKSDLARLERALASFMVDTQVKKFGYTEISTPTLVRDIALYNTGNLPKFADDLFQTTDNRWLIPTAEVTLSNLVAGKILNANQLPIRVVALSNCYRSEAGSAGRDTRGMLRQHEFKKVELVSITKAGESIDEHERMTSAAENILQELKLPYRTMLLCTGDMGFSSQKTYDIEVWLPGQDCYREISSCSVCGDFQSRRMKARYRNDGEDKNSIFVHTLNGSGLAVGRTLIAVMENYQQEDGSIVIPKVLRPYMGGQDLIVKGSK